MNSVAERRVAPEPSLAERLAWPLRLSRADAWKAVVAGALLTGIADQATGTEIWLGPVYLALIGLAAWSLGWIQAVCIGFAVMGMTLAINGYELYPYSGFAGLWNIVARIGAVIGIIGLLHTVRRLYEREWRLARTDLLTGALNRKAFFELTSARKSFRGWSTLVYVDLDGFKLLNDTAGHDAGDKCLSSFARAIVKDIRVEDVFARLGGDEFAIYLDVKDQAAAEAVAARLHRTMNAQLAGSTAVRCSVGALILAPGPRSIDVELRAADRLMYEAKGIGAALVVGKASHRGGAISVDRLTHLPPKAPQFDAWAAGEASLRHPPKARTPELQATI